MGQYLPADGGNSQADMSWIRCKVLDALHEVFNLANAVACNLMSVLAIDNGVRPDVGGHHAVSDAHAVSRNHLSLDESRGSAKTDLPQGLDDGSQIGCASAAPATFPASSRKERNSDRRLENLTPS
jgi:hypothetical protein